MSKLVGIVTAGSQKISLWGPQRTPIGILRFKIFVGQQVLILLLLQLFTNWIS